LSQNEKSELLDEKGEAIPSVGFYLVDVRSVSEEEYNIRQEDHQKALEEYMNAMRLDLAKAFEDEEEPKEDLGIGIL